MQTTTSAFVYLKYPVTMRASPTVSQSNTAIILTGATLPTTALSTAYVGSDSLSINVSVASGGVAGQGAMWIGNNTSSAFVDLAIEL